MKARIKFRKYGVMKFIGHLDIMRYFQKAMRRAEIPIAFTEGYSPHMVMSFAQPLGVGITSDGEYLDIELNGHITSKEAVERLNSVMVEGIDIVSFVEIAEDKKASGMTIVSAADYRVGLPESGFGEVITESMVNAFWSREEIVVLKKTKRSEKEVDIKPMIYDMHLDEDGIYLFLATGSERNLKPDLVMDAFLRYTGLDPEGITFTYHRLDVYTDGNSETKRFVSLEQLGKEIV